MYIYKFLKNFAVLSAIAIAALCFFSAPGPIIADPVKYPGINNETKTPFIIPLDGHILVSFRQEYIDEEKQVERKHTGIDISGSPGDKIAASANGIVSYCGFSPIGGRTVVIRHNEKIRTTYLNLKQVFVQPGVFIKQGESIGTIGSLDDPSSKDVHLHFGIIYEGKYLDPEDLLEIDYSSISRFIKLKYMEHDFYVQASK